MKLYPDPVVSEEKSYVLRTLQVPSLFVSLELNRALTRVYVLEDHSYPGDGDRRVCERVSWPLV